MTQARPRPCVCMNCWLRSDCTAVLTPCETLAGRQIIRFTFSIKIHSLRRVKIAGCWYLITIFWSKFATACTQLMLLRCSMSESLMITVGMTDISLLKELQKNGGQSSKGSLTRHHSFLSNRRRWSRIFSATSRVQCDSTQHHRDPQTLPASVCCAVPVDRGPPE